MRARLTHTLALVGLTLALGACASNSGTEPLTHYPDPWESGNRTSYRVHDVADRNVARPVAVRYDAALPRTMRSGINNFFSNLGTPAEAGNALLQGKISEAVDHAGRFVLNSTVGLFGFVDVASAAGLEPPTQDFGQTLAVWGVPSGPYMFVPLFGPTTIRDGAGFLVDTLVHPLTYVGSLLVRGSLITLYGVEIRASLLPVDSNIEQAADPYAFIRNAYWQRRQFLIHDGAPPTDDLYDLYDLYDLDDLD